MPAKYVAFDPGVATGIAEFSETGEILNFEILRGDEELYKFLDKLEAARTVEVVIYEEYRVGHSHSQLLSDKYSRIHGGQSVPTEQAIGAIKRTANKIGAKLVKQKPAILDVAQRKSGIKIPENHDKSHHIVALNHGIYYLTMNGILKPRVLQELEKKDK